jgi:very-short-patch-repair endonuclease
MAAVLACGDGAALSFRSAAALWRLLPAQPGAVEVSVPSGAGRGRRAGIQVHRCATLSGEQRTRRLGISVTTPVRTVIDLRRVVKPSVLRRALRNAEVLGIDVDEVAYPGGASRRTRSELEDVFLALCRDHGLAEPEVNVRVGSFTVDFLWRRQRVIVETDGYRYHRGRIAFEEDRDRDLGLRALGYDLLRFSHTQVTREPERVVSAVRSAL